MNRSFRLLLGASTILAWAGLAHAQSAPGGAANSTPAATSGTLTEVTVTAERRKSNVQKTAASITVRTGTELKNEGRFTLAQILEDVPGVTTPVANASTQSDQPGGNIVIRGVQPDGGSIGNATVPTTAAYVDDVYSGIGGDYDIASVQVLRGPQGTLYGRSATAGVVATTTNNPVIGKYAGDASIELGSYHLLHVTAALNVPLGEFLALRVAGNEYQQNGYVSAKGGRNSTAEGKAKLLYKPSSDISMLAGIATQEHHINSGGVVQDQVSPGVIQNEGNEPIAEGEDHFRQYWANANYDAGFANLTYIPAYRTWYQHTPSIVVGPGGAIINQTLLTPTDSFLTQELRIASNPGAPLNWLAGGFYYDNKYRNINNIVVGATGNIIQQANINKDTKDSGVFGEATYPFADTWSVTGGLRYDYTKIESAETFSAGVAPFGPPSTAISSTSFSGLQGQREFYDLTFRARIEKQLTPSNLIYLMASSGFLPGDAQAATSSTPAPTHAAVTTYAQEKLKAYEAGSKNRFLDNRLQINGDFFYYDYSGYQTTAFTCTTCQSFVIVTTPAHMFGPELEATYLLTPDDKFGLSYAYISAKYINKPADFAALIANTNIANIPAHTFTINYDHTLPLGDGSSLDFYADARYTSDYLSENENPAYTTGGCGTTGTQACTAYAKVGAQVIGDAHVTWISSDQKYSVTGYVRNLANNQYITSGTLSGTGSSGPNAFTSTATTYQPRVFGAVVSGKF